MARREQVIEVRVFPEEKERIRELATKHGVRPSEYLRDRGLQQTIGSGRSRRTKERRRRAPGKVPGHPTDAGAAAARRALAASRGRGPAEVPSPTIAERVEADRRAFVEEMTATLVGRGVPRAIAVAEAGAAWRARV
jgi:hypothetical protein